MSADWNVGTVMIRMPPFSPDKLKYGMTASTLTVVRTMIMTKMAMAMSRQNIKESAQPV